MIIIHCLILLKWVPKEQVLCLFILVLLHHGINLFQISENMPTSMKFLKIKNRISTTDLLYNLIMQIDPSSCLCALLMLRVLTIFNITSSVKQNEQNQTVETHYGQSGTVRLLTRGAHVVTDKPCKWFALILKSDSSLLLITKGRTIGHFSPL